MIVARARGLGFTYGGAPARALDAVDLDVAAGEVLLLEGPSGGGKSTLLRALCGLVPHFHGGTFTGSVTVDGLDTLRAGPARLAGSAALVFQDPEVQAVLGTVERDVAFGLENAGVAPADIPPRVREALAEAGAGHLAGRRIAELSGGERQRVALAGVLATRPRLLLADEPTSQLDDAGAAALARTLREIAAEPGRAVVLAEHRADRVRPIADRVLGVRDGRIGPPGAREAPRAPAPAAPGPALLEAEGVHAGHPGREVLRGADLVLPAGVVTVIHGANGSGKSTLLRTLAGLHAPDAGRVVLDGRDLAGVPAERRFPGIGFVGQDPGRHLLTERVDDELGMALRSAGLRGRERRARVAETLDEMGLAALAGRHPLDLSVGQRERVALAAVLSARPRVTLLDEPTRGMDPDAKAALAALLRRRAAEGAAVAVATHDHAFSRAAGDRVARLEDGRLVTGAAASAAAA